MLVGRKVWNLDTQQIFDRTGDIVAFPDFRRLRHGLLEGLSVPLKLAGKSDHHKDGEARSKAGAVENRLISPDHAIGFQDLDPSQAS